MRSLLPMSPRVNPVWRYRSRMWLAILAAVAAVTAAAAAIVTVYFAWCAVAGGYDSVVAGIRTQRHVRASRLVDVLIAIAHAADQEVSGRSSGNLRSSTAFVQLKAELTIFYRLGGPRLPKSDRLQEMRSSDAPAVRDRASESLDELIHAVKTRDEMEVALDPNLRLRRPSVRFRKLAGATFARLLRRASMTGGSGVSCTPHRPPAGVRPGDPHMQTGPLHQSS